MGQWIALSTFYIIPPALSLLATALLKDRSRYAGGPYPGPIRVLMWVLGVTILVGVLNLVLIALALWGDRASVVQANLVSSIGLVNLILAAPAWVGAYIGWYSTPLWFHFLASRGAAGRRRPVRRRRRQGA